VNVVFIGLANASLALQAVLLVCLLYRRQYRRYPLLLIYSLVFFAATLAETVVWHTAGLGSPIYRYLYMTDEAVVDLLLFLMVIAMIYQAVGENSSRRKIGRLLAVVVAGVVLLPLVLFRGPRWFYPTSQVFNFGAAIMNLALWAALLGNRKRDPLLLAVSAGLGVAVTGAAITFGLHHFKWSMSGTPRVLVDLIKSVAHIVSLVIWCTAFWPVAKRAS
jgi:hypothetical protein